MTNFETCAEPCAVQNYGISKKTLFTLSKRYRKRTVSYSRENDSIHTVHKISTKQAELMLDLL